MRCSTTAAAASLAVGSAKAASLASVCTVDYVVSSLPDSIEGITIDTSSVTAAPVYNATESGAMISFTEMDSPVSFCNVTFSYSHVGKDDSVGLKYYMPSPSTFKNRYLEAGGAGYAINLGVSELPQGLPLGAVGGTTDGGFPDSAIDYAFPTANGTADWDAIYMFAYQAHGEATTIGKALSSNFYNTTSKVYAYFGGCSDGGRQAWSQAQRYGDLYDGIIAGAPAFRMGQQQVNHLLSNVVEQTEDYYPPPCELDKIVNLTIAFCDPLDGKTDGVVSRSDLCKLHFDFNSTIGEPYYCEATVASSLGLGYGSKKRSLGARDNITTTDYPAQNGTVSAEGARVAKLITEGLFNTKGERAYISYQPGASFADAATAYDETTDTWTLDIASTGGEWVVRFLNFLDADNLSTLDNVTYDTLVDWMNQGMILYMDSLQTTLPDLSTFQSNGGKVIHYHGEQDDSVPTASSIHYWNSVREIMYPGQTFNQSAESLSEWYRLFLVPGAAHCAVNDLQPDGPFPETLLDVLVAWVEDGTALQTLNSTIQAGPNEGENENLCAWPLRPYWTSNTSASPDCVYDQASIDSFMYDFAAFKIPVY